MEELKDKLLVSEVKKRCPDSGDVVFTPGVVVVKRWQRCPRVKMHEIVTGGSGYRFITSITRCLSLSFSFCPGEMIYYHFMTTVPGQRKTFHDMDC